MEFLQLATSRLLIRNLKPTDLKAFHYYRSNPEVARYQGFEPMTKEDAASFIKEHKDKKFGKPGDWVQYGLEDKASGQLIGDCALKLQGDDPRIAEIGISIAPDQQQKGYAKETLKALLHFLFEEKELHRVVETVDAENIASIHLLESLHFRKEGYFLENIFFKGKWGSEYQYAMLQREWKALKSKTQ